MELFQDHQLLLLGRLLMLVNLFTMFKLRNKKIPSQQRWGYLVTSCNSKMADEVLKVGQTFGVNFG